MRHRPQKGAELHATIPEQQSGISSCGGFIQDHPQHQQQQQHSLSNVHQWATAAAMNRKSLDDVDLALSKQHLQQGQGGSAYYVSRAQMMDQEGGGAYYYGRGGGSPALLNAGNNGGGTLPRNFGGLIKEDKVRPVAKVQAQVVMRQVPSPPLKDTPAYVMAQQQQQQNQVAQPVYVNFGHLSNHVHHHYYGGDVNTNTIALNALQMNSGSSSSAIVVNTQAEVHHHHSQGSIDSAAHLKNDIKVSKSGN